jgi:hypothetical protein
MTKHSSAAGDFRKTAECPSSQALLGYHRHGLVITDRVSIEIHLRQCDFCNAELQLLMRHRGAVGESPGAEMPTQLRELAERLLARNSGALALLTDFSERHQLSH